MTFDQAMQLGGLLVTGATTLWGFRAVVMRLENYVTVTEYRAKTGALHNEINDLRVKLAVLEDRAKR